MSSLIQPPPRCAAVPGLTAAVGAFARPADHPWVCVLLLAGFSCVLFFHGITAGPFWRTEGLRAIVAVEFLRSGNWVVPYLYGEPLFTKPPGMYAAIALCSLPFGGVTEWTARLPSALAATATVFLFYWYFGRQLGRLGGLVAGLLVPLSPLWLEKAPSAEIDMVQVFWTAAAILFFLRALEDEETANPQAGIAESNALAGSRSHSPHAGLVWWLLAGLCMAGGFLTKWTTPAFFYLTAVPLLWWRGELAILWRRGHLLALGLAAGLCLAWAGAAVYLEGWPVFWSTVEREAAQRLVPGYTPFPYPWGETLLHPVKLFVVMLPLSAISLVTLWPGFAALWDERGRRLLQALHCWVWPNVLFWSLPTEHTPRHSFPLFPGVAGLAALVVFAWLTGKLPWRWRVVRPRHVLIGLLLIWVGLKLAHVHVAVPRRDAERDPRGAGTLLARLVPVDCILYIFRLKDEGVMFYYGRQVLRLPSPADLPPADGPAYCLLVADELVEWRRRGPVEIVSELRDDQGDPIALVRVNR